MNRRAQTHNTIRAGEAYYVWVTRGNREWAIYRYEYRMPRIYERLFLAHHEIIRSSFINLRRA